MKKSFLLLLLPVLVLAAAEAAEPTPPVVVPTPGGKVVSPNASLHQRLYGEWHFAPARVEGNLVYLSGIVAGAREGKALDVAGFEAEVRRAWAAVKTTLEAAGSSPDEIVDLTTFHVFGSPFFTGTKGEHIAAFGRVKDEFVPPPYPAWTGIGVAALYPDTGLVEIKVIARLKHPPAK
jgi:enamine deaminase RidA (YjgF/YER057c/UK114 family)